MFRLLRIINTESPTLASQSIISGLYVRQMCAKGTEPVAEKLLTQVARQVPNSPIITLTNWPYNLRIRPNDILDPNDVNSLRATLVSADPAATSRKICVTVC